MLFVDYIVVEEVLDVADEDTTVKVVDDTTAENDLGDDVTDSLPRHNIVLDQVLFQELQSSLEVCLAERILDVETESTELSSLDEQCVEE